MSELDKALERFLSNWKRLRSVFPWNGDILIDPSGDYVLQLP